MEENNLKKNNSIKYIVIAIIVVILIALIALGYYWTKSNNPRMVYLSTINSYLDKYEKELSDVKEIKTQNTTVKLSGNIESENESVKQVAEHLNKGSIEMNVQIDYEAKSELVNLGVNYDNDKLIDGRVYYELNEKNAYAYLEGLYTKYFKIDMTSSQYNEVNKLLGELFETQNKMKIGEKASLNKAMNIIKSKISEKLSDEYFSKENVELTINDKNVKTIKSTLTLTQAQFIEILKSICMELLDDEEFLNCWEDKDNIKEGLKLLEEQFEETKTDENTKIIFNIYNKGLLNNQFTKFEVIITKDSQQASFEIINNNDKTYSYKLKSNEEEIGGIVKIEEIDKDTSKIEVAVNNIPDFGNIKVILEVSNITNGELTKIDKSNSINIEDISQNDLQEIGTNLQKMKIYTLIESASNQISTLTGTNTKSKNNILNTTTNSKEQKTIADNSIKNYSGDVVVTYNLPSTFKELEYSKDTYRMYEKSDDTSVTISINTNTLEEFSKQIDSSKEYFAKLDTYKDVKTSDVKTLEQNGKTFSYKTFEYTYISSISSEYDIKHKTTYIYYPINDKNSLKIEIENPDDVTSDELNQFLNIDIEK